MDEISQQQVNSGSTRPHPAIQDKQARLRSVQPYDFRAAGQLSNENARILTAIHEELARHLTGVLDACLGVSVKVKLQSLEQSSIVTHIESVPPFSYVALYPLGTSSSTGVVECDVDLVFPIIDLLLGGAGLSETFPRELSEIEEEIMQSLMPVIVSQIEATWGVQLPEGRRIEVAALGKCYPPHEKVTQVKFEMEIACVTGLLSLVFPGSFVSILMNKSKSERPQSNTEKLRRFPTASIRERILDCDVVISADLPTTKVSIRDLIGLQPGCVLKLRAPIRTPGALTAAGRPLFAAMPVRNGTQKAAQLGQRMQDNFGIQE